MELGLKIPYLLRVTMPRGEGGVGGDGEDVGPEGERVEPSQACLAGVWWVGEVGGMDCGGGPETK